MSDFKSYVMILFILVVSRVFLIQELLRKSYFKYFLKKYYKMIFQIFKIDF